MKKVTNLLVIIFLLSQIYSCNTITGTAKGIVEDVKSVIPGI